MNRWLGATLPLISLAAGLALLAWLLRERGLDWVAKVSEVASLVLAAAGLALPATRRIAGRLRNRPLSEQQIMKSRTYLQAVLKERWRANNSSSESRLYESLPMRLRFVPGGEEAVCEGCRTDATAEEPNYGGDFGAVLAAFRKEPPYRRVVLGEAGAGKTVLVTELARQLLDVGRDEDPLPLILPAAAWEPARESLQDWVAQRLVGDYSLPTAHACALVAYGKVLPILDGLDEMASLRQLDAIADINEYLAQRPSPRPLVVTSRKEEYYDAECNGTKVQGTLAVELRPLLPADIKDYLGHAGGSQWGTVIKQLDGEDPGPLAQVLANPLMLWLACTVYANKRPDELIDRTLFAGASSIEHYLLDEFVPAVYADESRRRDMGKVRCTGRQAQRWLGFLASFTADARMQHKIHLDAAKGERRSDVTTASALAWWRLRFADRMWALRVALRAAVLWILAWMLVVWVLAQHGNWRNGTFSGPVNFGELLLAGPVGRLIRPTMIQLAIATPKVVRHEIQLGIAGLFHGVDNTILHPPRVLFAASAHPFAALYTVFILAWSTYIWFMLKARARPRRLKIRPMPLFGHLLTRMVICCAFFASVVTLAFAPVTTESHYRLTALKTFLGEHSTWTSVLAISLVGLTAIPLAFTTRTDIFGNVNPSDSLSLDRQADVFVTISKRCAFLVAIWLFCGPLIAGAYAAFAAAATLIGLFLGGQFSFASRAYTDTRIWMAFRGRLPWRTMQFLVGAEKRGVLRQVGAVYKFRHLRVLEQLEKSWSDYEFHRKYRRWDRWRGRWEALTDQIREWTGEHQGTLAGICEALYRYRSMAEASTGANLAEITEAVDHLALRVKRSAREEEALTGFVVVVEIYRKLAQSDPVAFMPRLEKRLSELASWLRRLGREQEALCVTKEAVDLYRGPAESDAAARHRLAEALTRLADSLHRSERQEEATHATSEAVESYRKLAEADPATFRPWLADILGDLADRLRDAKQHDEALGPCKEAAAIYGELANTDPSRFRRNFALSLESLAVTYRTLGRKGEEVKAVRAAFAVHRQRAERIAQVRRAITKEHLDALFVAGQPGSRPAEGSQSLKHISPEEDVDALAAARGAVAACRKLAKSEPKEFLPDLSEAVRGLALELKSAGREQEARMLSNEAYELNEQYHSGQGYRYWDGRRSEAPLSRMSDLALRLWKLHQQKEALMAIQIKRQLAPINYTRARKPARRQTWILQSFKRYSHRRIAPYQEHKVRFCRRMVRNEQKNWQRRGNVPDLRRDFSNAQLDLAEALIDYGHYLDTLAFQRRAVGRDTEAIAVSCQAVKVFEEAASICRELSGRYPDNSAYHSALGTALQELTFQLQAAGQERAAGTDSSLA